MTNFERITIIANQLANAGKKPTIAKFGIIACKRRIG